MLSSYLKYWLVFLLLFSFSAKSQDWAPTGAVWHYGVSVSPMAGPWQDYLKFESIGDTLISGKNGKVIKKTRYDYSGGITNEGTEIMYSDSNRVYHWINNQFHLIYDFNGQPNDSWVSRIPYEVYGLQPDSIDTMRVITVDSVATLIINFDTLKVLYVTASDNPSLGFPDWNFKNPIIAKIGADYMFAGIWGLWDTDLPYLRCYDETGINYKKYDSITCDTLITTSLNNTLGIANHITFFPNPFNKVITMRFSEPVQSSVSVFDITGKIIHFQEVKNQSELTIQTSQMNPGLYLVSFSDKTNSVFKNLKLYKQ